MNNFLRILSLSILLLPLNTYVSEPENVEPEKSYWQMYAPEFIQEAATSTSEYISNWVPQSVKDRINSWSTRKKLAIAGVILANLALIYNKDAIIALINSAIDTNQPIPNAQFTKNNEPLRFPPPRQFDKRVNFFVNEIRLPQLIGSTVFTPKQLDEIHRARYPHLNQDPAYLKAMYLIGLLENE